MSLKYFSFKFLLVSKKSLFYKIFWQILCIYILANLKSMNPKSIVTSIDNCCKFAWLSKNLKNIPCIAIQNGFRLSYDANPDYSYYCNHLFSFGYREEEVYPKLNYKVDHFYPVGSLSLANNYCSELSEIIPIYDLLIVSCWRGNIGYQQDVVDSMRGMRIMDTFLAKYLRNKYLKVAVILRRET